MPSILSQFNNHTLTHEKEKLLQVRAVEMYRFVRARHEGHAERCSCGRLLLQAECEKLLKQTFPK